MATAIMKQKEVSEMDNVEEIISKISEDSLYKRRPTQKRSWMTVPEMAQLLGTTRSSVYTILDNPKYSLFFEFIVIAEKKRITKESFQKFLEGQDRYKLDPSNDYEELAQEQ